MANSEGTLSQEDIQQIHADLQRIADVLARVLPATNQDERLTTAQIVREFGFGRKRVEAELALRKVPAEPHDFPGGRRGYLYQRKDVEPIFRFLPRVRRRRAA